MCVCVRFFVEECVLIITYNFHQYPNIHSQSYIYLSGSSQFRGSTASDKEYLKNWTKSVSLKYSCDEEYLEEFDKGKV